MYGTTMKSYNSSKSHKNVDQEVNNKSKDTPKTRYMKINERRYDRNNTYETTATCEIPENGFSRKEFPIASVIFTAIATMIVLLLTTGILG